MPFREESNAVEPLRYSAVLTHHWFVRRRGGEKVLEAFGELFPDSPLYTLVHDPAGVADSPLAGRRVYTSFLQRLPGAARHYPKLLPLMPLAARRIKLPPVELVLCSDAALAKAMTPDPRSKVVCYCHSPMRYAFDAALSKEYRRTLPLVLRPFFGLSMALVRQADRVAARRVNLFIANSQHVAERIKRYYHAEAVVVYPPVDIPPEPALGPRGDFYLCVGYHTPYKRLDLAIETCRRVGRRLVVIGDGPDLARFDPRREIHVEFLGWQPAEVLHDHLRRAAGLLFPGEEDFGIVPVEALAHGCPVIAYGVGGATETVVPDETGVLFKQQTTECMADALERCEGLTFDPLALHRHARQFGKDRFLRDMREVLESVMGVEQGSLTVRRNRPENVASGLCPGRRR
ncbi:MAG: glycosyltransferase [Phycisphaerae bacterium]|nr:glycosyltransferase [Phycisphaerae bacterium]